MESSELKERLRAIRDDMDKNHAIRLHRAISWLNCAEECYESNDDLCFIALWIAFNACYGIENNDLSTDTRSEFNNFMERLISYDTEEKIHALLWSKYSQLAQLERDKLVYKVENSESTYAPTKLGRTTAWCGLSAESGAMLAGFLRALIRLSQKKKEKDGKKHDYLRRLTSLDLLFVAIAPFEGRGYVPRKISKQRRSEIQSKIEALDPEDKPLLNLWRSADSSDYPTRRLLSSLRLPKVAIEKDAEGVFYCHMMMAVLLYEHSQGKGLDTLADQYGMRIGVLESGLKFTTTWMLNCLAQICSPGRCYNLNFLAMRCFELMENLSFGSTLGKLLSVKGIGRKTVQKLVDNNVVSIEDLSSKVENDLISLGIVRGQAIKAIQYSKRANL